MKFSYLIILVLLSVSSQAFQEYPITINSNPTQTIEQSFKLSQNKELLYLLKYFFPSISLQEGQDQYSQTSIHDYFGGLQGLLSVQLEVGTPSKRYAVNLDTTSSLTWVNYSQNKSTTFQPQNGTFYIPSVNGVYGKDTVKLAGQSVENQFIGLASTNTLMFEGSLGLGIDNTHQQQSIIKNGYNQNKWKTASYSIYLNRNYPQKSSLVIGGVNPKYQKSQMQYQFISYRALAQNYWNIQMDAITIKRASIPLNTAICDSSSLYIEFTDDSVYQRVLQQLGVQSPRQLISYEQAKKLPALKFIINGEIYSLENEYYTNCNHSKGCYILIHKSNKYLDYDLVLGNPFFYKYYTHFDFEEGKIGIAVAQQ